MNSLVWLHFLLQSFLFSLFVWIHHLSAEGAGAFGRHLMLSREFLWRLEPSPPASSLPSRALRRALRWAPAGPPSGSVAVSFILLLLFLHRPLHSDGPALQFGAVQFQRQLHRVGSLRQEDKQPNCKLSHV